MLNRNRRERVTLQCQMKAGEIWGILYGNAKTLKCGSNLVGSAAFIFWHIEQRAHFAEGDNQGSQPLAHFLGKPGDKKHFG